MVKIRKKTRKFTLPVSKTNCNRVKFGTHSLVKVLRNEGYEIRDGCVVGEVTTIPLEAIDLVTREKLRVVKAKES